MTTRCSLTLLALCTLTTFAPAQPDVADPGPLDRASERLVEALERAESGDEPSPSRWRALAMELDVPTVVDADGITHLAAELRSLEGQQPPVVVTRHKGEARSLLGKSVDDEALHAFARRDRVVLRKGRVDLVTDGRRWQENPRGNPRMAVGGTGDCLAGLTAGLLARGCATFDAARMAALWLTTAADELWAEMGPCYDAEDLLDRLPGTLRRLLAAQDDWPPVEA